MPVRLPLSVQPADREGPSVEVPSADPAGTVPSVDELVTIGVAAGLHRIGIAPAAPFLQTRQHLEDRKRRGLTAGMQFTYRNPARSTDPAATLPGARALIVAARAYPAPVGQTEQPPEHGRPRPRARVAWYATKDHYAELRAGLEAMASRLRAGGYRAVVVADSNALVDREAARRAGLGWYGKNANLLLPGAGSWFVLGSVITDAPLPPTDHRVGDGCGPCTRCLTGCPTGAIIEPGVIDAARCLAWLVQAPGDFPVAHREALGDRIYGCDDCQEVCPPNVRTSRAAAAAGTIVEGGSRAVDLAELLDATDDELIGRFGRWYIPRREPRYLRRNALVVLGNIAEPHHPDTDRWLRRYLADDDPMLRRHALWAARRLGRDDLLDAVRKDPDPHVHAELAVPVTPRFGA